MDIRIKRIYEKADSSDGRRILIDRIWPRGVRKEDAKLDNWIKDIAPSSDLRKWFNHEPEKFTVFAEKYQKELDKQPELTEDLIKKGKEKRLTLLYAVKDEKHNQAVVLKKYLEKHS